MPKQLHIKLIILFFVLSLPGFAQVVLNEIAPSNNSTFYDEYGNKPDWIELYNNSVSPINLNGYGLSDNPSNPLKWTFPSITIPANGFLVIVADDSSKKELTNHWETAVNASDTWKYKIPNAGTDTNWRNTGFNDASWSSGPGGIGYGDGDDATIVPNGTISVYMRRAFTMSDTSKITQGVFNMDFDDGFVAYLNGVEIARRNLGSPNVRPDWNLLASSTTEAKMYQGLQPDSFYLSKSFLRTIIRNGTNILSVETHNRSGSSDDLSSIPFLSFGIVDNSVFWNPVPGWFRLPVAEYLHAKFKLEKAGETVVLANPSGTIIDQKTYTSMEIDNSFGRSPNGNSAWCFFQTPSPGISNNASPCYQGYCSPPLFSLTGNFYLNSQTLSLTTTQPGGIIRYSRDGTDPTGSSTQYTGPISVDTSQVIRAKVFASNYLPSITVTNSYFIGETSNLPIIAITTTPSNLWDYNTGIYVTGPNASSTYPYYGANYWQDWEKPATIEYFDKSRNRIFRINAEIKINGGYSRTKPQKSFEVKMDDKWGTGNLDYPLIPDKSFIRKWDNWIIRNSGNDWQKCHLRDASLERVIKNTNATYMAQEPCLGFVNGQFFGVYYLDENDDHHFVKNNFGLKKSEVDFMAMNNGQVEARQGTTDAFLNLHNYVTSTNASNPNFYSTVNDQLDLLNFTDYFATEIYYANSDWIGDWTNNIKLWNPKATGGKIKYLTYDLDQSTGLNVTASDNTLVRARRPNSANQHSDIFNKLCDNTTFKQYFINRYADLINTIFLPANVLAVRNGIKDSIAADMPRNYAKYGGSMTTWNTENANYATFINSRATNARNHVQAEFGLTSQVSLTLNASPAGAGRIIISTITPGTYPWTGVYYNGNPVTITAVPNPGYTFNYWKSNVAFPANNYNQSVTRNFTANDLITAYFTGSPAATELVISEINYNSGSAADAGDWFEIWNYGSAAVDLSGWYFKDQNDNHRYLFPTGTIINSSGRLVLAADLTRFQSQFPSVNNVIGPIGFGFESSGELLRLYSWNGNLYQSVLYDNKAPWPVTPDGQGYTLELSNHLGDLNDGTNWFAGCPGGSPGSSYNAAACCSVSASISASGNTTFCSGSNVVLSASNGTGYTYQWKNNNVLIPGATNQNYSVNAAGNYTCEISNATCSQSSNSISVTVINPPVALINPVSYAQFCPGDSITLSTTSDTSVTYQWKLNGNNIAGATNQSYVTYLPGNYTVLVSNTCGGTLSSPVNLVQRGTLNPVVTASGPTTFCAGNSVTLNAPAGPQYSYQWLENGNSISGANSINYAASSSAAYSVFISSGRCRGISNTISVSIINPPNASIAANGPTSFCQGGSVLLQTNYSVGQTYQWYYNSSLIPGATDTAYLANQFGTYMVAVGNSCGTSNSSSISVTNNGTIPASITASGPTNICAGNSVTLLANTGTGYLYQWRNNGIDINGATNSSFIVSSVGVYTVFITDGGCTGLSNTIQVNIEPLPTATITASGPISFCAGGSVTLQANAGNGYSYQWQIDGSPIPGATQQNYVASAFGDYTVLISNACGSTVSNLLSVSAGANLVVSAWASGATSFCSGGNVMLNTSSSTSYSYQWYLDGILLPGATSNLYSANLAGGYTVEVTDGFCSGVSSIIQVSLLAAPVVTVDPSGYTMCAGSSVTFTASPNSGNYAYQWYKNSIPVLNATQAKHTAKPVAGSVYKVRVSNQCGSGYSPDVLVNINCRLADYSTEDFVDLFPNPFTDQLVVRVNGEDGDEFSLRIFNILSSELYHSSSIHTNEEIAIGTEFPTGIYLVEFTTPETRFTKRVVKISR